MVFRTLSDGVAPPINQVNVLRIALGLVSCFIGTFEFILLSFLFGTGELEHGPSTLRREFQVLRGCKKLKLVLAGT